MKKILFMSLIIVLLCILVSVYNNNPRVIIARLTKDSSAALGQLKYRVYLFGVLPVGEAFLNAEQLEEYAGQKVYHLSATAQALKIFSKIFSGYAVLDSYIDTQEFNPIVFKQKIVIVDKSKIQREVFYDQKNSVMSILGIRRQILPNTQDPLSAIFNIRRMDFDKIKDFEMNLNTNQKNYILEAKTEQKELSISGKRYEIVSAKVEIRRRDKNPYHKSNITIVLLKTKRGNTPVLIKVFASGFLIYAKLVEIR